MANITRYHSPMGAMPLGQAMDQLFRDAFTQPFGLGSLTPGGVGLNSNLYETENSYVLQALLPGVKADELQITAHQNVLTLRGKTELTAPEGARAILLGAATGEFNQQVTLPGEVDAEKATADYSDGVLTLTLPKSERARARTIKVGGQAQPAPIEGESK